VLEVLNTDNAEANLTRKRKRSDKPDAAKMDNVKRPATSEAKKDVVMQPAPVEE